MFQLLTLALTYGVMMFIWSFVFLNRSHDKVNQSFLLFLSNILIWMALSNMTEFNDGTPIGLGLNTLYWWSMMYLAITFLYFAYRMLKRRIDWKFFFFLALNTLTIVVRYLYPIDYSDPTFWRLSDPVVAPLMSFSFSLPAIYALFLVLRQAIRAKDKRQRAQFGLILLGIGMALVISVLSEYVLPAIFHVNENLRLMHYAIAIFVVTIFISIMRFRLFYLRTDYIYRTLFLNASEGILIVNHGGRIMSVNHIGKEILRDEHLDAGDMVSSYLPGYRFDADYKQEEMEVVLGGQKVLFGDHAISAGGRHARAHQAPDFSRPDADASAAGTREGATAGDEQRGSIDGALQQAVSARKIWRAERRCVNGESVAVHRRG